MIDRALLEAGLRTRGGRGRSAAKVTVSDAATLLLAVLATPVVTRANETIAIWRNFRSWPISPNVDKPFRSLFSGRQPVALVKVLERLIELPPEAYGEATLVLTVDAELGAAIMDINRPGKRHNAATFLQYPERGSKKPTVPSKEGDLTHDTKITQRTFHELHRLFYPLASSTRTEADSQRPAP